MVSKLKTMIIFLVKIIDQKWTTYGYMAIFSISNERQITIYFFLYSCHCFLRFHELSALKNLKTMKIQHFNSLFRLLSKNSFDNMLSYATIWLPFDKVMKKTLSYSRYQYIISILLKSDYSARWEINQSYVSMYIIWRRQSQMFWILMNHGDLLKSCFSDPVKPIRYSQWFVKKKIFKIQSL